MSRIEWQCLRTRGRHVAVDSGFYMIRHAESEVNVDIPVLSYGKAMLTSIGREQASHLARNWPRIPCASLTSPFKAAVETIEILGLGRKAEIIVDDRLREFSYLDPEFADKTSRSVRRERSVAFWRRCDPYYRDGDGGETFAEFASRVRAAIGVDSPSDQGQVVTAVTHGMVIAVAMVIAAGPCLTLEETMRRFRASVQGVGVVRNCAVVCIDMHHELKALQFSGVSEQ